MMGVASYCGSSTGMEGWELAFNGGWDSGWTESLSSSRDGSIRSGSISGGYTTELLRVVVELICAGDGVVGGPGDSLEFLTAQGLVVVFNSTECACGIVSRALSLVDCRRGFDTVTGVSTEGALVILVRFRWWWGWRYR